jgi:type I restriction-modification system DNA methylase subunit
MSLFQNTVIAKYLKTCDRQTISNAYIKFKIFFHNTSVQENIRNSKEEQYQGEFLIDLFVNILGYTKNPNPNFNLTTEYKNIKDAKKADGAIVINENVIGVIELKGTDTTDLGKVENQAFGYKNNQPDCVYVIISNFEKLRFYIDNAIEHIEFNLFTLSENEFEILYLCLAYENILKGIPKQIKSESLSTEDVITKKLYSDYSAFKHVLFRNIVQLNPEFDKLVLFKKTQKLLDRFLFVFFAEDRQLLPPNSIRTILDQWEQLKELDNYKPLYERFILYFGYMNIGRKGKQYDIFGYNGGLFAPDKILDSIKIDDDILYEHTLRLSNYDFQTEVDVDILGHIFEHSLNEMEEIQAEIEGKELDKSKTKRKKDGIFYTPKYITKYIVDNTVGKLCEDKKAELQLKEEDYTTDKKRQVKTRQTLLKNLTDYRNWLLKLKICDPACGSGAFLNQALDYLIKEHRYLDELQAKLFGDALVLSDIENSILENNLFGVDINEESVEIARLSLWLRTARPNRKLNDLSNNIKCGNSLIDDPLVAGDKAFNWFLEFPTVFPGYRKLKETPANEVSEPDENQNLVEEPAYSYKPDSKGYKRHGFDVIIGNPPYIFIRELISSQYKDYFKSIYNNTQFKLNTYILFVEKSYNILKSTGVFGFIIPNNWLSLENTSDFRKFLLTNTFNIQIVNILDKIFQTANVDTSILLFSKSGKNQIEIYEMIETKLNHIKSTTNKEFINSINSVINYENTDEISNLCNKISFVSSKFKDFANINNGILAYEVGAGKPKQTKEIRDNRLFHSANKHDESWLKYVDGVDVKRYNLGWSGQYVKYGVNLSRPRKTELFIGERILVRQIPSNPPYSIHATYVNEHLINDNNSMIATITNSDFETKYILAIINSKLISFWFLKVFGKLQRKLFPQFKINELSIFPIKLIDKKEQQIYIEKTDQMLSLNKDLHELSQKFQRTLQRKFNLTDLSGKLQNWYSLTYAELIKELGKVKIKMSLSDEAEWEDYFLLESKKAQEIKSKIETTDKEIDKMVYELYGLTEEEIKIVEGK